MGDLTTFTIYNDGMDYILDDSDAFCQALYDAVVMGRATVIGHGPHRNLVTMQEPRHADQPTIYVHMGNTVSEMDPSAQGTLDLLYNSPTFFIEILEFMRRQIEDLEALLADSPANPEQG